MNNLAIRPRKQFARAGILAALVLSVTACTEQDPSGLTESILECTFGSAVRLRPGAALQHRNGTQFCIEADSDATFVMVPFVAAERDTALRVTIELYGGGFEAVALDSLFPGALRTSSISAGAIANVIEATDALHHALRASEHTFIDRMAAGADPAASAASRTTHVEVSRLETGELVSLNVSTDCSVSDARAGRVVATSSHVAIVADTANPANGFTDTDWQTFATEYDQLVYPVVSGVFGETTDIDDNDHVVLFFTRAVNELAVPGSIGIAGGFFWAGDLVPRAGIPGRITPCASSNEAEILYLAVPDPEGSVRVPISVNTLRQVMTATIGHELQHLLNAGRRLYVTGAASLEESWLNEGLSYMAEELLFYAASELEPRTNIDVGDVLASQTTTDAFNRYAYSNLGRLNVFLQAPRDYSPMGVNAIPTRGAAWSFLRYAVDRHASPDAQLLRALIDGTSSGLQNVRDALGVDALEWMRDWAVSLAIDDLDINVEARFTQPSWATRELITALRIDGRYPLELLPISGGAGVSIRLQPGSSAYPVFRLRKGTRALLFVDSDDNGSAVIHSTLLRLM